MRFHACLLHNFFLRGFLLRFHVLYAVARFPDEISCFLAAQLSFEISCFLDATRCPYEISYYVSFKRVHEIF